MRFVRYQQIKVIATDDPMEFERGVNEAMRDLHSFSPKLSIREGPGFTAIITYEKEEQEGREPGKYMCIDCPYANRPSDRVLWAYCPHANGGKTKVSNEVCSVFHEGLADGTIEPVR